MQMTPAFMILGGIAVCYPDLARFCFCLWAFVLMKRWLFSG